MYNVHINTYQLIHLYKQEHAERKRDATLNMAYYT